MKKSDLRKLIREEIQNQKLLTEEVDLKDLLMQIMKIITMVTIVSNSMPVDPKVISGLNTVSKNITTIKKYLK